VRRGVVDAAVSGALGEMVRNASRPSTLRADAQAAGRLRLTGPAGVAVCPKPDSLGRPPVGL